MTQYEEVEDAVGVYHCLSQSKKAVFFKAAEDCVEQQEIEIPAFAKANNNDCPVVAMGQQAFREMERLKKISFAPESHVSLFQDAAFMSETLEEVELPAQTRYISGGAFRGTSNLRNVTVNVKNKEFVRGEDGCLYTADGSTLVFVPRNKEGRFDVPASVREIGGYAFHMCSNVDQIVLDQSANLEKIGEGAFSETAITEFTLPRSVSQLGACAFLRCRKLEKVSFGDGTRIQEFGSRLFEGCMAVRSLIVPKSVKVLRSGCLARMSTTEERSLSNDISGLETLKFEAGSKLRVIQAHVFCNLPLTEIELPDSLVELNELNFYGCDRIREFVIGTGNRKLKWNRDVGVLTSMNDETIHYARRDITGYELPDCAKVITYCAFYRCRMLNFVRLTRDQSVLEKIGPFAFADTGINVFHLPGSLKVIENSAFFGCSSLEKLVFPDEEMASLTKIGAHAFARTGISRVLIPDKVQSIGTHVFANSCVSFVKWPRAVVTIPAGTFAYCKCLEKIVLFANADVVISSSAFPTETTQEQLKQLILCREGVTVRDDQGTTIEVTTDDVELACKITEELALAKPVEPCLDFSELVLSPEDWKEEEKIGAGGFGDVYLARRTSDNSLAVVKHPKQLDNYDDFWKEVKVLSRLRHPATCGIIGATMATPENPQSGIYLEYCSNKSLSDKIFIPEQRRDLKPTILAKIVAGICYGMRYVHEMDVIHTDFKPANILLNERFEPKIADFGSATITNQTLTITQTIGAMTPKYKAPEIDMRGAAAMTSCVDVYAFGVSLWEILTGKEFDKDECFQKSKYSFAGQIRDGTRPDLHETLRYADPVVHEVISSSWSVQPSDRLSFDEIIVKMEQIGWRVTPDDPDSAAVNEYLQGIKEWEQKWPPQRRVPH